MLKYYSYQAKIFIAVNCRVTDCAEWEKTAIKEDGNSKTNIPFGWIVSSTPIRLTLIIPPS